jgi:hypothetical protein
MAEHPTNQRIGNVIEILHSFACEDVLICGEGSKSLYNSYLDTHIVCGSDVQTVMLPETTVCRHFPAKGSVFFCATASGKKALAVSFWAAEHYDAFTAGRLPRFIGHSFVRKYEITRKMRGFKNSMFSGGDGLHRCTDSRVQEAALAFPLFGQNGSKGRHTMPAQGGVRGMLVPFL